MYGVCEDCGHEGTVGLYQGAPLCGECVQAYAPDAKRWDVPGATLWDDTTDYESIQEDREEARSERAGWNRD